MHLGRLSEVAYMKLIVNVKKTAKVIQMKYRHVKCSYTSKIAGNCVIVYYIAAELYQGKNILRVCQMIIKRWPSVP